MSKPAEPKATSATDAFWLLRQWMEWGKCHADPDYGSLAWQTERFIFDSAENPRAEAKEAPEPERRDALERLLQKAEWHVYVSEKGKEVRHSPEHWRHAAFDIMRQAIADELAKQPAKEAPAGEADERRLLIAMIEGLKKAYRTHGVGGSGIGASILCLIDDAEKAMPSTVPQHVDEMRAAHAELSKAGIPEGALDERVAKALANLEWSNALVNQREHEVKLALKERDAARQEVKSLELRNGDILESRDAARQEAANIATTSKAEIEGLREEIAKAADAIESHRQRAGKAEAEVERRMRDLETQRSHYQHIEKERDAARQEAAQRRTNHAVNAAEFEKEIAGLREKIERLRKAEEHQWQMAGEMLRQAERAQRECERLTKEKEHSVDGYPRAVELMEQRDAALAREKDAMSAVAALMKLVKP